jgi:hypothetical protein
MTTKNLKAFIVVSTAWDYNDENYYRTDGSEPQGVFFEEALAKAEVQRLERAKWRELFCERQWRTRHPHEYTEDADVVELAEKLWPIVAATSQAAQEYLDSITIPASIGIKAMQEAHEIQMGYESDPVTAAHKMSAFIDQYGLARNRFGPPTDDDTAYDFVSAYSVPVDVSDALLDQLIEVFDIGFYSCEAIPVNAVKGV